MRAGKKQKNGRGFHNAHRISRITLNLGHIHTGAIALLKPFFSIVAHVYTPLCGRGKPLFHPPVTYAYELRIMHRPTPFRAVTSRPFVSGVQFFLVGLHVDVALQLGTRSPDLEPYSAACHALVQLLEACHTTVLHRMFKASCKVWYELVYGSAKDRYGSAECIKRNEKMTAVSRKTHPL